MSQPPQVKSEFRGTEADCLQQAAQDAQRAAQNGYVPSAHKWSGEGPDRVLTVLYQFQGGVPAGGMAPGPAVAAAMSSGSGAGAGTYPVRVWIDDTGRINRVWGIPIIGWSLRWIVLIPHFIVLSLYGFLVWLALLFTWIPVLFLGRFPQWGYSFVGGYLRWYTRVAAYALLMAVPYPPFSTAPGHRVEVEFDRAQRINRLWGIPILGRAVRLILLIPSAFVLWVLSIVAFVIILFAWIPVLIFGRYPAAGYRYVGGYMRWTIRVVA